MVGGGGGGVEVCVLLGGGVEEGDGDGAGSPKLHEPYLVPMPRSPMRSSKRPSDRSIAPTGHSMH